MDIVRVFNYDNSAYAINLSQCPVGKELLFDASSVERVLDMKNIRQKICDFEDDKRRSLVVDTAGGSQSKTFLTEKGLFHVIFSSRKPIARRFQDWVFDVIKTVATTGKYELETRLSIVETRLVESEQDAALARHQSILEAYDKQSIVYVAFMQNLSEGEYVVKIGWSDDLKDRTGCLRSRFGSHRFVYAIRVRQSKKFESYLHGHAMIAPHKFEEPINGMNRSNETFRVDDALFKRIKALMKREVHQFNTTTVEEELKMREVMVAEMNAENESGRLKLDEQIRLDRLAQAAIDNAALDKYLEHITGLKDTVSRLHADLVDRPRDRDIQTRYDTAAASYKAALDQRDHFADSRHLDESAKDELELDTAQPDLTTQQKAAEALRVAHMKPTSVTRGRFVQRYDPDTLKLVDHFAGPTEAIRALGGGCPQRLVKAADDKTIFKKFRWHQVDRDADPTQELAIGDTVLSRQANTGLVAVYSRDGTAIDNVFSDQKSVRDHLQIKSAASVSNAVSSGLTRKCQGVLLGMWDDVADALKEAYLETKTLPLPPTHKGRAVLQLDSGTGQTIARHPNVAAVALQFRMSHMTVVKACDSREFHAGFTWAWDSPA